MRGIDYYRDRLRIDKGRLDDELANQSEMLEQIGRSVSSCARLEAAAKRFLEQTESRVMGQMFQDDPKLAIARAQIDVKRKREWEQAHSALLDAREELAQWEALEKAWYGRGFDLRALGELWAKQYVTTPDASNRQEARQRVMNSVDDFIAKQKTTARRRVLNEDER